ncbi:MAG TPA: potassium/proton antiporter [Brevefilum fermentans]|nr:potassium/proton antiporter [Brevefilum fermentans]
MQYSYESIFFVAALLLLVSVVLSKTSEKFGLPTLIIFMVIGMIAGSEGVFGIHFDDNEIAKGIGILALSMILFYGGTDTKWVMIKPVIKEGVVLATLGVVATAGITGYAVHILLKIPVIEALLLGAIVSSTDAAAVFSILRSKGINLKGNLKPLLELESGSNDPMAMFLTIGLIELIKNPASSLFSMVLLFFQQMVIGAILGYLMGRLVALILNRIKLGYNGLYPVLSLGSVFLTFWMASLINGSGFLAVFIMGIVMNTVDLVHKRTLQRFHDGIGWLMQSALFLSLGLFIFPSRLIPVLGVSLLISLVLFFIARPLSVFLTLIPNAMSIKEKVLISWVGLRGAAPIILATFPMVAGLEQSDLFYNVIFVVVLTSLLIQGTSLPFVARWLKLDKPIISTPLYPLEYQPVPGMESELTRLVVQPNSRVINQTIDVLNLPEQFLITLIERNQDFIVPHGGTVLQANDTLLALTDPRSLNQVQERFNFLQLEIE